VYVSLNGDIHQELSLKRCVSDKDSNNALTWLTAALMGWNALHTILAPGVGQALCLSQCPCWVWKTLLLTRA